MKSIALVDLNSFTVRHFKARANDSGPNDAAEATLSDLCAIRDSVEHVILALDAPPYRRKKEFDAYKAHRPPQEPELIQIKKWLFNRLDLDGWVMAKYPGEEGEDIVGTLAVAYYDRCEDIRLCGADKDLAALVNDRVRMFIPAIGARGPEIRGPAEVKQKFGVEPQHMALYLALCGDTADGIPGVPKWGPVTAAKWINETGGDLLKMGVELAKQSELGPKMPMLWKHFASVYEQIPLWVRLTTLRCDVPIDADALLVKRKVQPLVEVSDADDSEFYDQEEEKKLMASDDATQGFIPFGEGELKPGKVPTRAAGVASEPQVYHSRPHSDVFNPQAQAMNPQDPPQYTHDVHGNKLPKAHADGAPGADAVPSGAVGSTASPKGHTGSSHAEPDSRATSVAASVVPRTQGPRKLAPIPSDAAMVRVAPPSWALGAQPNTPSEMLAVAATLMNGRFLAHYGTPEGVYTVMALGRELGLGYMAALEGFHIVGNRPWPRAKMLKALAESDPNCEWMQITSADEHHATIKTQHRRAGLLEYTYTAERARKAGYFTGPNKYNWTTKTQEMLEARVMSKAAGRWYSGATMGLHSAEEMQEEAGEHGD